MIGHFLLREAGFLEVARKEQVHKLGGEFVDRFLRRQINAVEVIDTAITLVGGEEVLLDVVEVHSAEYKTADNHMK